MSKDDEWVTVDGIRYEPRHKVIEECARVIEQWENDDVPRSYKDLIDAIRALKEPPPNPELNDLVERITPENRHEEFGIE